MKKLILLLFVGLFAAQPSFAQEEEPPTPLNLQPIAVQSLFAESVNNEQWDQALQYGRWLTKYRPKELEGNPNYRGDRNFRRMIRAYESIAKDQSDPALKEAYVDSALIMYDRALAVFSEDEIDHYQWRFNRARFIQSNMGDIEDGRRLTLEEYSELYELDKEKFIDSGDGYFINYIVSEKIVFDQEDEAIAIMNEAEPMAPQSVRDNFDSIRNDLFDSPEERIEFLTDKLEDTEEEEEQLELYEELFELYGQSGNTEKEQEMARTIYEMAPDFDSVSRLAEYAKSRGNYREANEYYEELLEYAEDEEEKAEINYEIADNYYQLRELRTARTYARRAASQDDDWGRPIALIGSIYAQAVSECTDGGTLERTDKVVYWLVLDYLNRAREVDSSISNSVQRSISTYEAFTPNAEEKFYMNWEDGDDINVGANIGECYQWISEDTTVR
ncbi:MAG: tetratricopeptide repeat protein [Cyclonatronaceae bacterium]